MTKMHKRCPGSVRGISDMPAKRVVKYKTLEQWRMTKRVQDIGDRNYVPITVLGTIQ
jgi:hypothetical protein